LQVERAGIRNLLHATDCQKHAPPELDDPRQTKRQLAADLSTPAAQKDFLSSLSEALTDEQLIYRCLLPISVAVQVII
jgi:hypothetical protein